MSSSPGFGVVNPHESDVDDARWTNRRAQLIKGLLQHIRVFVAVMALLLVVNWVTRGQDGAWWVLYPLWLWAFAWGVHLFGVAVQFATRGEKDGRETPF